MSIRSLMDGRGGTLIGLQEGTNGDGEELTLLLCVTQRGGRVRRRDEAPGERGNGRR